MGLPLYKPRVSPDNLAIVTKLLEWAKPGRYASVLDLGCGNGDVSAVIAAQVGLLVGLDHCRTRIDECQQNHPEIASIVHNCQRLNTFPTFGDSTFDQVYAIDSFHLILRDRATRQDTIRGCFQALKPGGLLVCEYPGAANEAIAYGTIVEKLNSRGISVRDVAQPWYPDLSEMKKLMQDEGFEWLDEATDRRSLEVGGRNSQSAHSPYQHLNFPDSHAMATITQRHEMRRNVV